MTALTLYRPWRERMWGRDLLPSMFRTSLFDLTDEDDTVRVPRVDVTETETEFNIKAELPGFAKKEIDLEVADGVLTLSAEHTEEKEEKKENYHLRERHYGSYSRSFRLPEGVDSEKIDAKMENGVLNVILPKREEEKPKKIEVKVH